MLLWNIEEYLEVQNQPLEICIKQTFHCLVPHLLCIDQINCHSNSTNSSHACIETWCIQVKCCETQDQCFLLSLLLIQEMPSMAMIKPDISLYISNFHCQLF
jgi:hypothetical protein